MNNRSFIDLAFINLEQSPFPHFHLSSALSNNIGSEIYKWLEKTDLWSLTEAEFYEQYEFDLLSARLPDSIHFLINRDSTNQIRNDFIRLFNVRNLELVSVVAHKLVNGQKISIHNDFIGGEETHRLVIHLNPYWKEENGGFLMLFNSQDVNDISKVISPVNNSVFGFEISSQSFHAVSKIYDFSRYTLVYTFKENDIN